MTRHTPRWSVCRRLLGAGWPSRWWTTWGRNESGGWPGWRCRKGGGTRRKRSSWETAETAGWIRRGRRTSTCCTKLWRVGFRGRSSSPLYVCECSWAVTYFNFVSQSGGTRRSRGSARPCEELRGKQLSARCWTRRWISLLLSDAITSPFTATTTTKLSGTSWTRSEVAPPTLLQLSTHFHNLSFICKEKSSLKRTMVKCV